MFQEGSLGGASDSRKKPPDEEIGSTQLEGRIESEIEGVSNLAILAPGHTCAAQSTRLTPRISFKYCLQAR